MKKALDFINNNFRYYAIFVSALTLLYIAFQDLKDVLWVSDNDIVPVRGTIGNANFYLDRVQTSGGRYGNSREKQVLELIFYLKEYNKKFRLVNSIDVLSYYGTYSDYQKELNSADTVTVWVHKDDSSNYEPRIYGIDIDGYTLLSKTDIYKEAQSNVLFSLSMGIFCIVFPFVINWVIKIDKTKD